MQMSWSRSRVGSNGSAGLTSMMVVSSTFLHTSSESQRNPEQIHGGPAIGGSPLFQVQNHDVSIHNLDSLGNVNCSERIVSGNHNTLMVSHASPPKKVYLLGGKNQPAFSKFRQHRA